MATRAVLGVFAAVLFVIGGAQASFNLGHEFELVAHE